MSCASWPDMILCGIEHSLSRRMSLASAVITYNRVLALVSCLSQFHWSWSFWIWCWFVKGGFNRYGRLAVWAIVWVDFGEFRYFHCACVPFDFRLGPSIFSSNIQKCCTLTLSSASCNDFVPFFVLVSFGFWGRPRSGRGTGRGLFLVTVPWLFLLVDFQRSVVRMFEWGGGSVSWVKFGTSTEHEFLYLEFESIVEMLLKLNVAIPKRVRVSSEVFKVVLNRGGLPEGLVLEAICLRDVCKSKVFFYFCPKLSFVVEPSDGVWVANSLNFCGVSQAAVFLITYEV